ncbi:MAG: hypothetical protein II052_05715 [Prevotella sp.]|nr:hypothetical protein [Prevotella sp.]
MKKSQIIIIPAGNLYPEASLRTDSRKSPDSMCFAKAGQRTDGGKKRLL